MIDPNQHYVTVQQAAKFFGVSPQSITSWIRQGGLPAKRMVEGGRWLIPVSALKEEHSAER